MNARQLQHALLMAVRQRMRNPDRWVSELSHVLHKSQNAIYKKMQLASALSLEEILTLCTHYGVAFDPIMSTENLTFRWAAPGKSALPGSLLLLRGHLQELQRPSTARAWYAGGVPLHYLLHHPTLFFLSARMACYGVTRETWSEGYIRLPGELPGLCHEIAELLSPIPSREFWSATMFDTLIGRISYAASTFPESTRIEPAQLCTEMLAICDTMARRSSGGVEGHDAIRIFHNELRVLHASVLLSSDNNKKCLYLRFGQPDAMFTTAGAIVDQYEGHLDALAGKSEILSAGPGRTRRTLISLYRKRILEVRTQIDVPW